MSVTLPSSWEPHVDGTHVSYIYLGLPVPFVLVPHVVCDIVFYCKFFKIKSLYALSLT
jgi:hypothetical protein